jgi:lipoprotein-releasing system ATP-binding protein
MNSRAVLQGSGIHCSYGSGETAVRVLEGADITVYQGEVVAVTGPSGSGKSTLLHALGLLEKPDLGRVIISGEDGWAVGERRRAQLRNRSIGFVFQFHHLLEEFTLAENAAMPCLIAGLGRREAFERASDLLDRVGLSHRGTHFPSRVSGGERQRAAIARALVMKPDIVLADEPTGNLDSATSTEVEKLIMELAAGGESCFLLATHSEKLASSVNRRYSLDSGVLSQCS